jgi:RimJ/RimL family protein N-acetyltransferase
MTELNDVESAFAYGDSVLVGERVRLRGLREDDLPTLARWEMDPGRMATLSSWVAPPSEAAAKERIAKWCANDKDDLGFAIETLNDSPVLVGNIHLFGARAEGQVRDDRHRARPRAYRPRVRHGRDAHHCRLRVPGDGPAPDPARGGAVQPGGDPRL